MSSGYDSFATVCLSLLLLLLLFFFLSPFFFFVFRFTLFSTSLGRTYYPVNVFDPFFYPWVEIYFGTCVLINEQDRWIWYGH